MALRWRLALLGACVALGCSTRPVTADGGGDGEGSTGVPAATDDGPGMPPPMVTTGPPPSDTGVLDTGGSSSSDGVGFISHDDYQSPGYECDLHQQDCERGQKCVPLSVNHFYDGTACVPVVADPLSFGDECELPVPDEGNDACGFGQFCRPAGTEGLGRCTGLCLLEDPDNDYSYYCEERGAEPSIGCQSCFCICEVSCNPLMPECAEGEGCYPAGDQWLCAFDASAEGGAQNEPCDFINGCDPGNVCLQPDLVPGCDPAGAGGCCTAVCDVTQEPDPCPDAELGGGCVTWYEKGFAPPGFEDVGVCIAQG